MVLKPAEVGVENCVSQLLSFLKDRGDLLSS